MNSSFWISLCVHVLLGGIFFISLPTVKLPLNQTERVPIIIDLKKVEFAEKTNLPAKAKEEKNTKKTLKKEEKKKALPVKKQTKIAEPKIEKVKPVQKAQKQPDAVAVVEKKEEKKMPSIKPKEKPKKKNLIEQTPVKTAKVPSKPQKEEDTLDSLLASVEKITPSSNTSKEVEKDELTDLLEGSIKGLEGGKTKVVSNKLSISQLDFIQTSVRKHWRRPDDGDLDLKIELRVFLDEQGNVLDVEFLDKKFYNATGRLKANAESALRAVYICDKMGEESPFRVLALKSPETYSQWKEIDLNFDFNDEGNR